MTPDALTADEDLWGRLDIVLGLKCVGFFTRREPAILDCEPFTL